MPRTFSRNVISFVAAAILAALAIVPHLEAGEGKSKAQDTTIYELRTYTTAPGKLDELHKRFRDHTVGLFAKHGMKNVIYWTPVDQENTLVYLLQHDSPEARDKSFAGFRSDPEWKKAYAASRVDGPLVTKVDSRLLRSTDYSPEAWPKADGMLYELRIYTTNEGKLPNLNARFRDHTMKIFQRHGIANVLYSTPLDDKQKDNTLVYVIAHKDADAAKASWDAFRQDPEWKKVAVESQRDGRILVKGGVQSLYLTPTDYSPKK